MKIPSKAINAVKDMKTFLNNQGIYYTEEQIFKLLLEFNMIDRFGNATEFAIENGLMEEISEKRN